MEVIIVRLYGLSVSGNCWKAAQILTLIGHRFEWVETDSNAGATRTPEFLALNPSGKVPTLVLSDGAVLTESKRHSSPFRGRYVVVACAWPVPEPRARVAVFEQYSHAPYIAVARNLPTLRRAAHLHGFDLAHWPGVQAWVERVARLPGLQVLTRSAPAVGR